MKVNVPNQSIGQNNVKERGNDGKEKLNVKRIAEKGVNVTVPLMDLDKLEFVMVFWF